MQPGPGSSENREVDEPEGAGGDSRSARRTRRQESFLRFVPGGEQGFLLVLAVVVGLLMGGIGALFRWLISISHHFFFQAHRWPEGPERPPLLPFFGDAASQMVVQATLPAIGGLIVGLVIYRMLSLTGGHGVPSVMRAVATGNVNLSPYMAVKSSSSIVTISSGGSAGTEGPSVEIGGVVGSLVGRWGQLSRDRVGTLIGCGAASGIAAIFNTPIGGVFLALELLMRDFAVRTFGPVVIAAVVASVTSQALLPEDPVIPGASEQVMATVHATGTQIMMFGLMGLVCGVGGALLVYFLYRMHDFFQRIRLPLWAKPALGGLGVGVAGLAFPDVIGEGYEFVRTILRDFSDPAGLTITPLTALLFMFVAFVKILVTSLTLGSGGTGGSFAPAMVTGASIGAGFGVLSNLAFPEAAPAVPVFALVGMAGTVCSSLNVPIAGILIVYEIAGADYRLVLPLMSTVAVSALVSSGLKQGSVYTLSLLREGFDVEKALRRRDDPLMRMPVRRIMRREFTTLRPEENLRSILGAFSESQDDAFVVVGEDGGLQGLISARDLRGVLNVDMADAIIAADAADSHPLTITPERSGREALEMLGQTDADALPVVARHGSRKVVGLITRVDVLAAYGEASGQGVPGDI